MTMKVYGSDNSELMTVQKIYRKDGELVMEGIILESMPIIARVKPAEIRHAMKMLSLGDMVFAASMIFRGSR
jgi:hypothetical protein